MLLFYRAHHSKTIDIYILFRVDSRHQLLARYYGQYVLYTPVRYIADVDKGERIYSAKAKVIRIMMDASS